MIHWISIDALLEALNARGFNLGVDVHVRILRFLEKSAQKPIQTEEDFKYRLAALVCRSPAQQNLFYEVYAETLALLEPETTPSDATSKPSGEGTLDKPVEERPPNWQQPPQPDLPDPEGPLPVEKLPTENSAAAATRTGPTRLSLQFPPNPLRPWNTTAMDRALRPLREKEWAGTTEWDIPASIRNSIRAGGTPQFVTRRRKKAPQYRLLIDQRSSRDHLAGLYAELAAEMNRRDLSAECFFYDFIPFRCWRDFRDLRTHTDIMALQGEYAGYKLLIVGEPDGLLNLPDLRPSNLAIDLRDNWSQVALLCTKPTTAWTNAEWALGQLFPVAPANAAGLRALPYQWQAAESINPPYWLQEQPEPSLPELTAEGWPPLQRRLQRYLGMDGFHWLCATAVYPELYWELTTLLNDESIPPTPGTLEQDLNQQWQTALQRLSRLSWFRQGALPPTIRTELLRYFKKEMPAVQRSEVRRQLIEVLGLDDNRPPDGSWAAADKAFILVHLEAGRAADESTAPDADPTQQSAWAREAEVLDSAQRSISQADLEEAIGRKLQLETVETPGFAPRSAENLGEQLNQSTENDLDTPVAFKPPYIAFVTTKEKPPSRKQKRADQPRPTAFVSQNQLNVFNGPGITFETIGSLTNNARIIVLEQVEDWLRIGKDRWIHQFYTRFPQSLNPEDWIVRATVTPVFSVLWVDDKPEPNRNLRKELADALGVRSLTCLRTEEALKLLKEAHFDLIVSDTTREGNPWAGIDMLQEFKALGIQTPCVASTSPEKAALYEAEFLEMGALGVFSRQNSMKGMVEQLVREKEQRFPRSQTPNTAVFRLLWVDDYPKNNTRWIKTIQTKHGAIAIKTVLSTEEALLELVKISYQAVISDLGRTGNNMEGLTLLEVLREKEIAPPLCNFCYPSAGKPGGVIERRRSNRYQQWNRTARLG